MCEDAVMEDRDMTRKEAERMVVEDAVEYGDWGLLRVLARGGSLLAAEALQPHLARWRPERVAVGR